MTRRARGEGRDHSHARTEVPSQPSRHRDLEAPLHCAANGDARSGGKQKLEPPA